MSALRLSFGVPDRWRKVVPLTAGVTALALLSVGAPAVASPAVSAPVATEQVPQNERIASDGAG